MALEELKEIGVLRPEEEWGEEPKAKAAKLALILDGLMAAASGVLMYMGGGTWLTWTGFGLFFLSLVWFTWLSLRQIGK